MLVNSECQLTHLSVLALGGPNTGKTTLINRFLKPGLPFNGEYIPTIQNSSTIQHVMYSKKRIETSDMAGNILEAQRVILQCMEIGGKYPELELDEIPHADAFMIVYSVTDRESFNLCYSIYHGIVKNRFANMKGPFPIILIGTKVDLVSSVHQVRAESRKVSLAMGQELAKILEIPFLETTALAPTSVNACFKELILHIQKLIFSSVNPKDDQSEYSEVSETEKKGTLMRRLKNQFKFKKNSSDSTLVENKLSSESKRRSVLSLTAFKDLSTSELPLVNESIRMKVPVPVESPSLGTFRHQRDLAYSSNSLARSSSVLSLADQFIDVEINEINTK
ncbi:hypothetical protein HDV01_005689 [Terramyces sp. JEL0728]|nr:hypothetical protein HDV01_005689 [Terramyces sp. JEL0728]